MKRLGYGLLFYLAMCCGRVQAGEVILHLPDDQIHKALGEDGLCLWNHLPACNDSSLTEAQRVTGVLDWLIGVATGGHYKSLDDIGGSLEVRYDQP